MFPVLQRFQRSDKRTKLPLWIQEHLKDSMCNLSTEEAVQVSHDAAFPATVGRRHCWESAGSLAW